MQCIHIIFIAINNRYVVEVVVKRGCVSLRDLDSHALFHWISLSKKKFVQIILLSFTIRDVVNATYTTCLAMLFSVFTSTLILVKVDDTCLLVEIDQNKKLRRRFGNP